MNYPDQDYPDKAPALAGLYEATRNLSTADAAQIIRISKGYNIPTVDAAAALPTFGSYANDDVDWDGVRVRAPLTTEFLLNDPYYAKALQSSIRDMEAAEGTVKTWKALQNGFKGVGRGLLRFGQMVQETVQNADNTLAPINEADVWANPAKESVRAFENQNKTFVPATTLRNMAESSWLKPKQNTPDGLAEELWLGFMETVPQVAAQLLVAGATGGTSGLVAGTLFMGSQIAGSQYEKLAEQKVEPFRAFQAAIADAVMQAPLEMISLGKTFKRIPVGKAAREYMEKATTEAITEWAQQYPEAATEIWATRPGVSMQQVAVEIVNDIASFGPISQEGLKQGVIAAPFGLLGGWAANNAAKLKERRAEAGKAYAESLQEKAAKMSGASPEAAAAYINHVTGDDVVYAQPDALFQIALDKPEIIEALGVTIDEVEQARADGQLVEIPIGEYSVVMSSNPDAAKILNEHITTDVSEETLTEARERASVSRNQKDVSDATTEARQAQSELKSAQKELYDEAVSAGMKPDEAGNLVAMFTANSRIYAAAKGQSHAQWFRENRPVIRKGREMVAGAMGQPDWTQKDISLPSVVSVIKIEKPANATQLTGNTVKNIYSKVRRQFQGKTFINSHTGWEIGVSKTGLGKVISHAASPEIQLTLSELDKMIERSIYLKTARDGENRPDIKAWHYFYAPVDIGDKNYTMKIVVRETIQGQKFYDHAIVETERPAGKVLLGGTPEGELRHQAVSESSSISIDDLIQNVNQARQVDPLFQSAKGSIHWEDGKAIISLFKTADASTGIHELLGHYMTQNLLDWGSQDDAPDWMKQDRKTMLEWAGIEDWNGATKEQKVEAHEKWARAAEAYVMEGKAPSLELRDVFRRFADWMRQVYRAMRDMGVEIGPGMRGVFDRMLASEEEIAHASAVSEFMNENADLYFGLTDRQKESLAKQHDQIMERGKEVLMKELIGDINAERKQAMAAERERIEAEVRHEVSNQPFYRMVRELRKPAIRNPVNELTKEWQKKVDDMARYLRDHHGDGVENVKVYDGDIRDERAKPEAYFRVSHNVKWYQDLYAELGKTPTLGDYKMLAEDFLRRGFEDLSGYVDPDVEFLEIEQQLEELQKTPQAIPMVQKINTAWLKENYPEELNTFAFMHSNLGQYDLDDLASFYRFSSADEIIWRMKNTPPLSKAIKDAVDARMNEAFPALTNAEIAEKAEAAMHNEESVALLAVQLDLIREKAGQMRSAEESRKQALQDRELARVSAQKAMEKMPLERAMNLPVWIAAARRAAVKADKAIAEGNWVAAFEQKNIQLHNNAMIQESLNARREFDRVSRYLKRQQGSGKDTWITDEAGPDGTVAKSDRHFAAAGEIMKRYGFGRRDAVEPKEPLSEYVRKMEEENPEMVSIAEWIAVDVKGAPLRSLTLGKLRDIESALRNIKKMARAGKNADGFVTLNGDGLIMTVNNLVDAAEANAKDRQVDMPDKVAPSEKAEFMAGLRKPSKWLLELDGFKDFGAWAKAFYHALADATDFKSFLVNRALRKLEAAYQRAGIDKAQRYRDAHTKIYVPEWETSMSKNWMMAVLLNMGSESNMQRLFSRHPVGISVNTAWNRETVTTVLARELGANYFRLAQDIWDAIDVYDEYAAMVKKVTGATLQKVNPSPISFTMPNGETIHLRGGYYHLKADPRSSQQAEMNAAKDVTDAPWIAPYPNTGASKARAAHAAYPIELDLSNVFQSIQSQAHDIAFRPVAIDINKLMRSEAVKEVFRRKLGDAAYKTFSKWLRVIESGKNAVESQGFIASTANFFRQRAVVANLLFRVGTVFQNFANPALYGNAVEGFSNKDALMAYMKYGWGEYIPLALSFNAEAETIRQEVFALSAMMRDKAENPDYTMRDMFDRQDGFMMNSGSAAAREVGARLKIGRDSVVKFGSGMLAFGDQLADIPVWRYAYHKALNEGRSQREAVRFADSVIENSTGTGRAVDSSMLQMGDPMEKLLTMFMTFVNTQYNRWANEYGIYMKEKDHARLLSFIGVQYLMFGALSAVFSFKGKKDDEELLEWFTKEVLEWPLSMIPIVGNLAKLAIDRLLGFQSYSWAMSPVERNLEQTAKLAATAWQGKATTEDAMQTAAFLFGYPDQFNDWFWNAYDASVGNMDPELRDLVRRRPKRERR